VPQKPEEPKGGPHVCSARLRFVTICAWLATTRRVINFEILNKLMAIGVRIRGIHSTILYPNLSPHTHVRNYFPPTALLVFPFTPAHHLFHPCDTFITHVRLIKKLTTIMTNISKANTPRHATPRTRSISPHCEINI